MRPKYDLAVMDWGIGGLSVHLELTRQCPRLSQLYFSDSGQIPYGKMSARRLEGRLRFLIQDFARQGIRHVVIACNAASTALPALQKEFSAQGLRITGVIEPGIQQIRGSKARRIGVIGGRRTILSRSFNRPFKESRKKIRGRIAQPLSALIEAGEIDGPKLSKTLKQILAPLKNSQALLLACTHYPAVAGPIRKVMPDCELLDPANATARIVRESWRIKPLRKKARHNFVTSGDAAQMRTAAHKAFKVRIGKIAAFTKTI